MENYFKLNLIFIVLSLVVASFYSCSYSINLVQSSGTGQDKIDDDQVANPTISPDMPISLIPSRTPQVMSKRLGK